MYIYIYMYCFNAHTTDSDEIQEHFHKNFGPVATVKTAQEKFRK